MLELHSLFMSLPFYSGWLIELTLVFAVRLLIGFAILMKIKSWGWHEIWYLKPIIYPVAFLFVGADILFNWHVSIYYKDMPATVDETFTWRMKRYKKDRVSTSYHHRSAVFFCGILNKISQINHC